MHCSLIPVRRFVLVASQDQVAHHLVQGSLRKFDCITGLQTRVQQQHKVNCDQTASNICMCKGCVRKCYVSCHCTGKHSHKCGITLESQLLQHVQADQACLCWFRHTKTLYIKSWCRKAWCIMRHLLFETLNLVIQNTERYPTCTDLPTSATTKHWKCWRCDPVASKSPNPAPCCKLKSVKQVGGNITDVHLGFLNPGQALHLDK